MGVTSLETGPMSSSSIQVEQVMPTQGMGSKEPIYALGINTISIASAPQNCPNHTTVTHIQKALFALMLVPQLSVRGHWAPTSSSKLFLWVFPTMVLQGPFAHITPPSLLLNSRSSTQCLAVVLCIYFHQLLEKVLWGQLMKPSIRLQGKGSLGTPTTIAYILAWDHPCGLLGESLVPDFLTNPTMAPSFKISLSLLSLSVL